MLDRFGRALTPQAHNRLAQKRSPDIKIFFIGFNKTATSALHHLMSANGIKSVHFAVKRSRLTFEYPALEIERRRRDKTELKTYLSHWTAFSDLTYLSAASIVEGCRNFKLFHELFPEAFFILNDRDTEAWIKSRLQHRRFMERTSSVLGHPRGDIIEIWRKSKEEHTKEVLRYFRAYPRFLHFKVDTDDVLRLAEFLSAVFHIDAGHWKVVNATAEASDDSA